MTPTFKQLMRIKWTWKSRRKRSQVSNKATLLGQPDPPNLYVFSQFSVITKQNGNRQGTRYYSQASERPPNGQTNQKTVPKPEEQQIKTAKETQTNQSSPPATPVLGGSTAPAPTKSQPEANKSVSTNGKWRACYICQGDNHPPGARVPAVSSYLLQQDCLEYKCRGTLLCANCGYSDHLMKVSVFIANWL